MLASLLTVGGWRYVIDQSRQPASQEPPNCADSAEARLEIVATHIWESGE